MKSQPNSFGSLDTLRVGDRSYAYYRLDALERSGVASLERMPFSLKILLENLLRFEDGSSVTKEDIEALARWNGDRSEREIAFTPARVLLQDFTGVPCIVDLAAMRDAMAAMGGEAKAINPLQPVELVIDHSVQVDYFGSNDALAKNTDLEFERNRERYAFLSGVRKRCAGCASCRREPASCTRSISSILRASFSASANRAKCRWPIPTPPSAPTRTRRWSTVWASWRGASAASRPRPRCSGSR